MAHRCVVLWAGVVLLACSACLGTAQTETTCSVSRVSLSEVATTTYVDGNDAYTVSLCTAGNAASTTLTACAVAGFVQHHLVSTSACVASYDTIISGLAEYTATSTRGVVFTVSSDGTAATNVAEVRVQCDEAGSRTSANLISAQSVTSGGVTTLQLTLTSFAGCSVSSLFCSDTVLCAESSRSCVNGVCFDSSCGTLNSRASEQQASSAFAGLFAVADCHGTPLSGLDANDFLVYLNGVATTDAALAGEVPLAVQQSPQSTPAISTLLLDQSASVRSGSQQTLLQDAAKAYLNTVAAANSNHFVALLAFDGSADPVVVQDFTTDHAAAEAAVDSLPPSSLQDPTSTNLYGAVAGGIDIANAMRFSFGPSNTTVVSSMIVFTDGYDTAGRMTREASITHVQGLSSSVQVISIGVAETSDTAFLTDIATSGIYSFPSTSALVASFTDVANQVANLANSVYTAAMCIPLRSETVAVTITLNQTARGITTTVPTSYSVDASAFAGGCDQAAADDLAQNFGSNQTDETSPEQLTFGSTVQRTVPADSALFFDAVVPADANSTGVVTIRPTTVQVSYVEGGRCRLSPLCEDGSFNTTLSLTDSTSYAFLIRNTASTGDLAVTLFFGSNTTIVSPTAAATTAAPLIAGAAGLTLTYQLNETSTADLDNAASWIFFGYIVALLAMLLLGCAAGVVASKAAAAGHNRNMSPRQAYRSKSAVSGGGSGGAAAAAAAGYKPISARYGNNSATFGGPMSHQRLGQSAAFSHEASGRPMTSGISPYHGASGPPGGVQFHDPYAKPQPTMREMEML